MNTFELSGTKWSSLGSVWSLYSFFLHFLFLTFLVAQTVKNLPSMQETQVQSWVGKISWRTAQQSTPVFLHGEFHGQRSLMGYSPWACKESDLTEWRIHTLHFLEKIIKFYFMSFVVIVVVELGQLPLTTLPAPSCIMKLSTLVGENI